jgi:hypothetical protein
VEIVVCELSVYFLIIFVFVNDNYGFTFISSGDQCVCSCKFVLDVY